MRRLLAGEKGGDLSPGQTGSDAAARHTADMGATSESVLITGVTGHAAWAMAAALAAYGFRTKALVRDADQRNTVADGGHEPVVGDLTDPDSLAQAVVGVDVVVHAAVYGGAAWDQAQAVNVDGTRLLAEAARVAGVRRFVHISTVSAHGDPQPEGLTEDSPLAPDHPDIPYVATKARGELALEEVQRRGLETVVLRPGAICSAVRSQWGDEMVERIRTQGWPEAFHPADVLPWIHSDDLASMAVLAATHPNAANEAFLAVDRDVEIEEFLVPLADALGVEVKTPERTPERGHCRIGKARERMGYAPGHTFEATMVELLDLAGRRDVHG